jgi:hypothetical protein
MLNIDPGKFKNDHKYIDVKINREVLDNIIVRLYPNCDLSDSLIVKSLVEKYTRNGIIEESHLGEVYRKK